mmetsp:Transcript_57516/g.132584  ORF Transcript_57516/g.132584 Transcript_57516/m.132584 type:complete len:116 (+) Transcript_57516:361-708(+)
MRPCSGPQIPAAASIEEALFHLHVFLARHAVVPVDELVQMYQSDMGGKTLDLASFLGRPGVPLHDLLKCIPHIVTLYQDFHSRWCASNTQQKAKSFAEVVQIDQEYRKEVSLKRP